MTSMQLPVGPAVVEGEFEASVEGLKPAAYWVPIERLHGWKDNPRVNADAIPVVKRSIKRFGWGTPLVARSNGELIAGHTRIAAATLLKMKEVPVRYMDHLSEEEAHALALADNKTAELAEWDKDLLAANVGMLDAAGVDLTTGTGFTSEDIDALLNHGDVPPEDTDGDAKLGDELTYSVVVECEDERQQAMLLERLDGEGFRAKPLIS